MAEQSITQYRLDDMNELIQHFHFLRPWWFLALIPALLCMLVLWFNQKQDQQLNRVFSSTFLPFLLDKAQVEAKKWPLLGLLALWIVSVVALAGPAWQKIPQPVERSTQALVVAWDMSPSMLAEDVKPSRLQRSRLKLIDLLNSRTEGQVALVAYSGDAHTVTPLTDDFQTIINLLPALAPTTLPSVGSNPEAALAQAIDLLKDAGVTKGNILFLTDAIAPSAFETMADMLRQTPHTLTIWGVGTTDGAPIPLPSGGFAKKQGGDIVIAKLNENELQRFASRQGGYYVPMLTTGSDIDTLGQLLSPATGHTERSDRTFDQWFEHGQFLALLLLPFVAWLFRKGWVFSVLIIMSSSALFTPQQAQALSWDALWLNQNQRAQKELEQGNAEAAREFTSHERRGAALFRNESFVDAAQEFAKGESAEDAYNRGNALAHAGEFEQAVEAFDRALTLQPDFKRAEENRAIAQQLAEMKKQNQEQQGNQNQQGGNQQQGDSDKQKGDGTNQNQDGEGQKSQEQTANDSGSQNDSADQQNSGEQQDGQEKQDEELSDAQAQKPPGEKQDTEQNPYSKAEQEQASEEEQKDASSSLAQKGQESSEPPDPEQHAKMAASMEEEGQTEEEQMLEQWLRKVPDDPSGLLRNKFKYQHMQRQRQLERPSPYTDQAEQRW